MSSEIVFRQKPTTLDEYFRATLRDEKLWVVEVVTAAENCWKQNYSITSLVILLRAYSNEENCTSLVYLREGKGESLPFYFTLDLYLRESRLSDKGTNFPQVEISENQDYLIKALIFLKSKS